MNPPVYVILTTYRRKETCLRTVESVKNNLIYDNLGWFICDDHSPEPYVEEIVSLVANPNVFVYDGNRKGVGHMMNHAITHLWDLGVQYFLMLEDDWVLNESLDLLPYVKTLENNTANGMIRFGYLSPGLTGHIISEEGQLYWRVEKTDYTYRFTGHPSLRHRRFHDVRAGGCGLYTEGLPAGATELDMCGKVNSNTIPGNNILYPCAAGQWGFFSHIGTEHMGSIEPGSN